MASECVSVVKTDCVKGACSVDLYIQCMELQNKDLLSKSDPCAVLSMANKGGHMMEIGRTETMKNTLNPKFARPIRVDYRFEEIQNVLIKVYDVDNPAGLIREDDELGSLHCTLGQLVANNAFKRTLLTKYEKGKAQIVVRADRTDDDGDRVELTFNGRNLADMDILSKSDPYIEIQKETKDGQWLVIHRTEVIKNNLNPTWRTFSMSTQSLCDDDKHKHIKIDCYDQDDNGKSNFIGGFTTTLNEIMKLSNAKAGFACIDPQKAKKKNVYTNSGIVHIACRMTQSVKEKTFLDFVFGGMKMNFIVGIDFTQSNGDPSHSDSLHHINLSAPNEYMLAIRSIGDICQCYDSDKLFAAFGFGAKIPPSNILSHDFPINFNYENPNCRGIDDVLNSYMACLLQVDLLGPTIVAPVINRAMRMALDAQIEELDKGPHAYHVLLLLTDGIVDDMPETKHAIIEASSLPLSLIIVGVGISDFTEMKELSGERGMLTLPSGEQAKRDIVQFVCFKDFKRHCVDELANHVLAKIPRQVADYFKMRGLKPNNSTCVSSAAAD